MMTPFFVVERRNPSNAASFDWRCLSADQHVRFQHDPQADGGLQNQSHGSPCWNNTRCSCTDVQSLPVAWFSSSHLWRWRHATCQLISGSELRWCRRRRNIIIYYHLTRCLWQMCIWILYFLVFRGLYAHLPPLRSKPERFLSLRNHPFLQVLNSGGLLLLWFGIWM